MTGKGKEPPPLSLSAEDKYVARCMEVHALGFDCQERIPKLLVKL